MTYEQWQELADAAEAAEKILLMDHLTPQERSRLENALEAFRGRFGIRFIRFAPAEMD